MSELIRSTLNWRPIGPLSRTAEYALRGLVALARHPGPWVSAEQIAADAMLPAGYLSKVLNTLAQRGVLRSRRGPSGGFALIRPADEITVLEIAKVIDPWSDTDRCAQCAALVGRRCALHAHIEWMTSVCERYLEAVTIEDLASA